MSFFVSEDLQLLQLLKTLLIARQQLSIELHSHVEEQEEDAEVEHFCKSTHNVERLSSPVTF